MMRHVISRMMLGVCFLSFAAICVQVATAQTEAPSTCENCEEGKQCAKCMAADGVALCGKCGHAKDSEECCQDDCAKCEACGLHADSPLCCKVPEGYEGKDMCTKCGHEAGSAACCKDDCKTCATCGMHHDSPLCCQLVCPGCKDGEHCAKCMAANGVVLCGKCGHAKGSSACCSDDCEKCETCGLHAGSPLCCKVDAKMAGKDMCTKCGHAAGSACCKDDCETCESCGMHAGSPLCCKLVEQGEAAEK